MKVEAGNVHLANEGNEPCLTTVRRSLPCGHQSIFQRLSLYPPCPPEALSPTFDFPTSPNSALVSPMKTYLPQQARRAHHVRVPAFVPVPVRGRADGWTAERQARFLVALARTRSVCEAARGVGMARETAYRLRKARGGESFAAAWDAVLGRVSGEKRKVTVEERLARAFGCLIKPMVWQGELAGLEAKADNSALLGHLARLARGHNPGRDEPERSQGLNPRFASTAAPPLIRGRLPDRPGRTRIGAPFRACRGAGPRAGIRR